MAWQVVCVYLNVAIVKTVVGSPASFVLLPLPLDLEWGDYGRMRHGRMGVWTWQNETWENGDMDMGEWESAHHRRCMFLGADDCLDLKYTFRESKTKSAQHQVVRNAYFYKVLN